MRVLVSGGGTGGHIYPAMAIYKAVEAKYEGAELLYVGSCFGIEHELMKNESINYVEIQARGLERGDMFYSFVSLLYLFSAFFQSMLIMNRFKPDVVIGVGGFVSFPVLAAAYIKRAKILIHEQNSVPGLSNRLLAKIADRIMYSFEGSDEEFKKSKNKAVFTGNPIRREFVEADREESRQKLSLEEGDFLIVSVGGSSGSACINDISKDVAQVVRNNPNLLYKHIVGKYYEKTYHEKINTALFPERVEVLPYSYEMHVLMSAADFIISRSGAIAMAEIEACRTPCILIPSPNVANDHQLKNAKSFEKYGCALVVEESELENKDFGVILNNLIFDKSKLEELRRAFPERDKDYAIKAILATIEEVLSNGKE